MRTDVSRGRGRRGARAARHATRSARVHLVCNNAGVFAGGNSWEVSVADWEWVLGVNLWGAMMRQFMISAPRPDGRAPTRVR